VLGGASAAGLGASVLVSAGSTLGGDGGAVQLRSGAGGADGRSGSVVLLTADTGGGSGVVTVGTGSADSSTSDL
jgi:hypothetical protein